MVKCAICEVRLSSDSTDPHCDSAEHIIPNSIGGKKTISGFICRKCNSMTGQTWDAALAEQMHALSVMFGVSRGRGETPPLKVNTTAGERVTLRDDGALNYTSPEFEKRLRPDGSTEYSIKARSVDEARRMIQGLKRKHPELDVEAMLAQATTHEKYLDGDLHFALQFGGADGGRSMVKTCLAFAHANDIGWQACGHAIAYLRDPNAQACFGYFSSRDLVSGRSPDVPLHCVALRADPATGLILSYAEYFGVTRIVACLGENYSGPLIESVHAFDPRTGDDLELKISLNFDLETINAIFDYEHYDGEAVVEAFSSVLGPALRAQNETESDRVVRRAVDRAFQDCGASPGEQLTEEHLRKISHSVAEDVAPFLLHQLRGIKRPSEN